MESIFIVPEAVRHRFDLLVPETCTTTGAPSTNSTIVIDRKSVGSTASNKGRVRKRELTRDVFCFEKAGSNIGPKSKLPTFVLAP